MKPVGFLLVLVLTAAGACDSSRAPVSAPASVRQSVVGGAPEPGYPAVGAIVPVSPICGEPDAEAPVLCTGTLVAPRVVLTAAHCVENTDAPQVLSVVFASETARALGTERVRVVDGRIHPDWRAGAHDIGVLILAEDAPVPPMPLHLASLPADFVGRTTRVVGFGLDEDGRTGLRRSGTARVTATDAGTFSIEAAPAMSCGGDSGGPSILDIDDTELVIGVTAFGDLACTTGTNTRVDAHADFLHAVMEETARAPPTRPRLDAAVDTCTVPCEAHADCPLGMACVVQPGGGRSCAVAGLEAGRFGALCSGPDGAHPCVKAGDTCRLWQPCDEAPGGGCAAGGNAGAQTCATLLALASLLARRYSESLSRSQEVKSAER
ncbi:S1 family peptidase [Pyxidicoccus parkwayensis]|uniref:S1 family peptidase n=1 Tax=Pyxidicoccus parkwayensis TaxID=2813578 RepID=A0ABX7P2D7_9BACT|nr:S1 family peptidase [Pyxidicoccus parkwaysis]QSQ23303.1 S1 family peptidase [Pyxidicoccus parkwaysis]